MRRKWETHGIGVAVLSDERLQLSLAKVAKALNHVDVILLEGHLAAPLHEPQRHRDEPVKHRHERVLQQFVSLGRQAIHPALHEWAPPWSERNSGHSQSGASQCPP